MKKFCSFYVSNWHLLTSLIPYIGQEIDNGKKIVCLSQNDLETSMKFLMERLSLDKQQRIKISGIKWLHELLMDGFCKDDNTLIIVHGSIDYIKEINKYIESKIQNEDITFLNCFDIYDGKENLRDILKNHTHIVNSDGVIRREIMFPDYKELKCEA